MFQFNLDWKETIDKYGILCIVKVNFVIISDTGY